MISSIIGAVGGLLKLAGLLTEYLKNRQLIEAGKARAIADALTLASNQLAKVRANRARFKSDPEYASKLRQSFKRKG